MGAGHRQSLLAEHVLKRSPQTDARLKKTYSKQCTVEEQSVAVLVRW